MALIAKLRGRNEAKRTRLTMIVFRVSKRSARVHPYCFYTHSYRHWATDNAIEQTGHKIMALKNSENRTVVVLQVRKARKEKQTH